MGQTPITMDELWLDNEQLRHENQELRHENQELRRENLKLNEELKMQGARITELRLLNASPAFHALPQCEKRKLIQSLCPSVALAPVNRC